MPYPAQRTPPTKNRNNQDPKVVPSPVQHSCRQHSLAVDSCHGHPRPPTSSRRAPNKRGGEQIINTDVQGNRLWHERIPEEARRALRQRPSEEEPELVDPAAAMHSRRSRAVVPAVGTCCSTFFVLVTHAQVTMKPHDLKKLACVRMSVCHVSDMHTHVSLGWLGQRRSTRRSGAPAAQRAESAQLTPDIDPGAMEPSSR